ncbi:MAG TPA: PIN domain-containing protein [Kofleriaceae bacterium]|nr:PIN domain-containing protein [Kofleriaceae bacterium]
MRVVPRAAARFFAAHREAWRCACALERDYILRERPELAAKLARTRELMESVVADCMVTSYEPIIASLTLPDPDDRHVLAAAIRAHAQTIVTFNLRDFPAAALSPFDVEARHPDDFVLDQIDLAPARVIEAVIDQAHALRNPPKSVDDVLDRLADCGCPQSVAKIRSLRGDGG